MKTQFPTVQEQINYWNEIERLELERVSRIQEAESRDATNETRASQAQKDHEQQRLFEADHEPSFFECGGTFNGFECSTDADPGL